MIFEEKHEIGDIAIIIIVCIAAVIIGIVGVYTYYKSYEAFIAYIGVIFLTYSTISLVYTFLNKSDYDVNEYNINLGLDITAVFISLILTIFFSIKSFYISYSQPGQQFVKSPNQYY
jgi:purine-cytosine permease-like protein